ncbi:MAG: peptidylprolyl isomerase [Gemmatales bacterium]|nr:peptidylprolyl isomerase [Gemmatales bacterium]MDW7994036.1 peptidylprolyl isomerase [Gemmatales bacterium]
MQRTLCVALVCGVITALLGCGDETERARSFPSQREVGASHTTSSVSDQATSASAPSELESENARARAPWKQTTMYTFLHQPFEDAIQPAPPRGSRRPPDITITGKSVGKLFEEAKRRWPEVSFVTPTGNLRRPIATMETELGEMEITLWPEIAPNHVRAFVVLAELGYYDGLFFEVRVGDRKEGTLPRAIGGGSPEAQGQTSASIGFWLKPEILLPEQARARGIRHQPGTMFCPWLGCFFYIALSEAPMWEGEFVTLGEVVRNLSVAERIFDRLGEESDPPQIRRVTVRWQDTGKSLYDLR